MFDYLVCNTLRYKSGRRVSRNWFEKIKALEGVEITGFGESDIYPTDIEYYGHVFSIYVDKEGVEE